MLDLLDDYAFFHVGTVLIIVGTAAASTFCCGIDPVCCFAKDVMTVVPSTVPAMAMATAVAVPPTAVSATPIQQSVPFVNAVVVSQQSQ